MSYILKVNEVEGDNLPATTSEEAQQALSASGFQVADLKMAGTRVFNGEVLILCLSKNLQATIDEFCYL